MFRFVKIFTITVLLTFSYAPNANALGPLDGELNLNLWNNDFDADLSEGEIDAGSLTADGEIWIADSWGLRGAYYRSDLEGSRLDNRNRIQLDIRRRFLSLSDNNFLALGVGLEDISLENGDDTKGLRLSAEGRVGLVGAVYLYGRAGIAPSLQDAGNFEDISSKEYEVGVRFTPFPFLHFKFGYLNYELDYDDSIVSQSITTKSSGFILGAGIHW